jgi:hypothetical protein
MLIISILGLIEDQIVMNEHKNLKKFFILINKNEIKELKIKNFWIHHIVYRPINN